MKMANEAGGRAGGRCHGSQGGSDACERGRWAGAMSSQKPLLGSVPRGPRHQGGDTLPPGYGGQAMASCLVTAQSKSC